MMTSRNISLTRDFLVGALGFTTVLDTPDDLEASWEAFSAEPREGLRIREPFTQAYGMKEFHVDLPGTETLLFVGQVIPPPSSDSE